MTITRSTLGTFLMLVVACAAGFLLGIAARMRWIPLHANEAQGALYRAHRVSAMAEISALEALRRNDATGAAQSLEAQLDFEILGLSQAFRPPIDNPEHARCQLTYIHWYRSVYPAAHYEGLLSEIMQETLQSLPAVPTTDHVDSCLWVKL